MKGSLKTLGNCLYVIGILSSIVVYNLGLYYKIIWMMPLAWVILFLTLLLYVKLNPKFHRKPGEQRAACAKSYGEPKEGR